jgi:hypothetical protein
MTDAGSWFVTAFYPGFQTVFNLCGSGGIKVFICRIPDRCQSRAPSKMMTAFALARLWLLAFGYSLIFSFAGPLESAVRYPNETVWAAPKLPDLQTAIF